MNSVESKKRPAALLGGVVLAAALLVSCGAAGAGSGGGTGGGALGATFTLPAGSIQDWAGAGQAQVELRDAGEVEILHTYGPVAVVDNFFPGLQVGPPPAESLLSWADIKGSWEEEFSIEGVSLSVSDENVMLQLIDGLHAFNGESSVTDSPDLVRESDGNDESVSWVYVDRDVEVTGEASETLLPGIASFTATVSVDLSLKAGWNSVRGTWTLDDTSSSIEFFDGPEPADSIWRWDGPGGEALR